MTAAAGSATARACNAFLSRSNNSRLRSPVKVTPSRRVSSSEAARCSLTGPPMPVASMAVKAAAMTRGSRIASCCGNGTRSSTSTSRVTSVPPWIRSSVHATVRSRFRPTSMPTNKTGRGRRSVENWSAEASSEASVLSHAFTTSAGKTCEECSMNWHSNSCAQPSESARLARSSSMFRARPCATAS